MGLLSSLKNYRVLGNMLIKKIFRNLKHPVALVKKIYKVQKEARRFSAEDEEYWIELKGKYKGQRGFVIGNGPSLIMSDLEAIKDDISIASNKVYLAFPETTWRPDFYTVADPLVWEKIKNIVVELFPQVHIPTYLSKTSAKNIKYWKAVHLTPFSRFSGNLADKAVSGQTVTFENIQLAVHLGLDPIYIIGCDHNYPGEGINVKAGNAIKQGEQQTHFIKNYRKPGESVLPAPIQDMEIAYQSAKDYCDKHGISIYNATRGGQLNIFERALLDEVLASK